MYSSVKIFSGRQVALTLFFFFLGQKTVLTNVQEELDRMTRKPDSMVTTSSPPTENEA